MDKSPFFIVAASRSGTTMLRLMLNAHSAIAVPHEMKYFGIHVPQHLLAQWQRPELTRSAFERIIKQWIQSRAHAFEEMGVETARRAALDAPTNFRAPFQIVMDRWARYYGKKRWGEKTPDNIFYVDIIAEMFPEARFIFLVRDPRAVVRSMNAIEFFSDDTVINAYNWREMVTQGFRRLTSSTRPEQRLMVHYEMLVKEPERTLGQVCAFLGEAFEPAMLNFHESARSMLPQSVRTPNIQRPIDASAAEKWKNELSREQIALIEAVCREPMKWWGYEPVDASLRLEARLALTVKSMYWLWKRRQQKSQRNFTIKYTPFGRFYADGPQ